MDQTSIFVHQIFGDEKTLYEILGVEKKATEEEIKQAYKKLALIYHPDRKGGNTEKFKALSIVHSILSDKEKRSLYDSNGDINTEDAGEDFKNWYEYFRYLFPKITVENVDAFSETYKGSEEERVDLIEAYNRFNGKMEKLMGVVMLAEVGEEERLCTTVDSIISFGDLKSTPDYEKFKLKYASGKPRKNKRKSVKKDDSEADLAALILSNKSSKKNGLASIMAKYGDEDEDYEEVSDEGFQNAQKRVVDKMTKDKKGSKGAKK